MSEHTPTPWHPGEDDAYVWGPDGEFVAECEDEANAEHIVRAMNSHEDLLRELQECAWVAHDATCATWGAAQFAACPSGRCTKARAAIAKARGEQP